MADPKLICQLAKVSGLFPPNVARQHRVVVSPSFVLFRLPPSHTCCSVVHLEKTFHSSVTMVNKNKKVVRWLVGCYSVEKVVLIMLINYGKHY